MQHKEAKRVEVMKKKDDNPGEVGPVESQETEDQNCQIVKDAKDVTQNVIPVRQNSITLNSD